VKHFTKVKEKKLRPVYEDKWQIESTLLFRKEDVLKLQKQLEKPGYITAEVAEILEIHPTTLSSYIKKRLLKAEKDFHIGLGKDVYFIKEELERFQREYQTNNKSKQFFIQNGNYYLFQSLRN
jgi:predicted XRE-type DNA-binding protein